MKQFFKFMFASMLGLILGSFLLLFILIGIIGSLASGDSKTEVTLKENSVLELDLNYIIPERTRNNPFEQLPFPGMKNSKAYGLDEVLNVIKKAGDDANIKGIFLRAEISPNSYATLEEIRNELIRFKQKDKFIVAYGEYIDEHAYYLASVADKIYMNPAGEILLNGFSQQVVYLKGMLNKLGVEPELIRHGKYKSAGEPLIADKMSNENRQQIEAYMGNLYNHFINQIAKSRKMDPANFKEIVDQLKVRNREDALTLKVVDGLKYYDEVEADLRKRLSLEEKAEIAFVNMGKMKKVKGNTSISDNKIAVVYCTGDIVSGQATMKPWGLNALQKPLKRLGKMKVTKRLY